MANKTTNTNRNNSNKPNKSSGNVTKPSAGPNAPRSRRSKKQGDIIDKPGLNTNGRDNDPNWYFTDATIAEQASRLSFQDFVGMGEVVGDFKLPSICVIPMNPSPGMMYDTTQPASSPKYAPTNWAPQSHSGIMLAAQKQFIMQSIYSGRQTQYTMSDIAITYLAVSSVVELAEHIRRAFGLLIVSNMRNRTVPKFVLEALGFDSDDLFKNSANLRMRFNTIINRLNQIPLLDNIGYIRKSRDIYQHIYVDSPTSMAQLYVYVPSTVWEINEEAYEGGTVLEERTVYTLADPESEAGSTIKRMAVYLDLLETMVDKLVHSATLNYVYADCLNLASKANVPLWKMDFLAENYIVAPEYNENFLLQLNNLTVLGRPAYTFTGYARKQKNGAQPNDPEFWVTSGNCVASDATEDTILYNPIWIDNGTGWFDTGNKQRVIVNFNTDNPSMEDIIESLRFTGLQSGYAVPNEDVGDLNNSVWVAIPDHYAVALVMYDANINERYFIRSTQLDQFGISDVFNQISKVTHFNHHPYIYVAEKDEYYGNTVKNVIGDLAYFTTVDYAYLKKLLNVVYQGLFDFRV